ncbi:MAG: U32 family peptidase [Desulfuromonadales bacterium]|nr:U32 family peptidase [Desulfuromonadales bacterium]NIR34260.1 U32 family peptidase [Desulfuromonadales bacterium]NIS42806.1 U32 family peptidase [Desulfuromonadales bacterium]
MNKPELLAPAGDLEKLNCALDYGADAVYLGSQRFGLRAAAGNFSLDDLATARETTARRGKKLYLTLNAYLTPADFKALEEDLRRLRPLEIDAYIVADPGVLSVVRQIDPQRSVHLSTQANTTNAAAVEFWRGCGVSRVNLARELTLEDISAIGAESKTELEVFVHGAMCIAWSGRCLLSAALTGRSANKGACSHPCRWRYALVEETRPGEYFPVEEDERGTYIMNSRDICLLGRLPDLLQAGVHSLKIEGRMKSLYYVAAVTRVYRAAIDRFCADPTAYSPDPQWRRELDMVSHRPYGEAFLDGHADPVVHAEDSRYIRTHDFIAVVRAVHPDGSATVEGRNRFFPGDPLEVIGPDMRTESFTAGALANAQGEPLAAGQPNARIRMAVPAGTRTGDLLRREKD